MSSCFTTSRFLLILRANIFKYPKAVGLLLLALSQHKSRKTLRQFFSFLDSPDTCPKRKQSGHRKRKSTQYIAEHIQYLIFEVKNRRLFCKEYSTLQKLFNRMPLPSNIIRNQYSIVKQSRLNPSEDEGVYLHHSFIQCF